MRRCQTCGELHWAYRGSPIHRCPPRWEVRREDNDGEPAIIYALRDDKAADKWAKQHRDAECIIFVQRQLDPEERTSFWVSGGNAERTA